MRNGVVFSLSKVSVLMKEMYYIKDQYKLSITDKEMSWHLIVKYNQSSNTPFVEKINETTYKLWLHVQDSIVPLKRAYSLLFTKNIIATFVHLLANITKER